MRTEYQAKNLMTFHLNQMEHTKKNGQLGVTGLVLEEWRIKTDNSDLLQKQESLLDL